MLALSLTLVAGTVGQVSLGHAALLAIGAYASALLALDLGVPVVLAILGRGLITAALGTLLISPAFRLRGHYVSIATLAIGEIVGLVILNWESLTRGPIGISGIPPLSLFGHRARQPPARSTGSAWRPGRCWRCCRSGCWLASRPHACAPSATTTSPRAPTASASTATRRWPSPSAASPPASAAPSPRISTPTSTTRPSTSQLSILALTMVILGGMGNVVGAHRSARWRWSACRRCSASTAEYRMLIYGIVLLLLIRFRPQGLLGTV